MDWRRLEYRRIRKQAEIGDLVICVDVGKKDTSGHSKKFIGLVLDKSVTIYRIQVVDTADILYWPATATYLWKEIK